MAAWKSARRDSDVLVVVAAIARLRKALPFGRRPATVRGAVVQFAVSGLVVLVLLGGAAVLVLRQEGRDESIRDARTLTQALGLGVVEQSLDDGLLVGDEQAVDQFDRAIRRGVLSDQVVRVKIWSRDGRVIYSDEPRLIGSVYPLGEEELAALDRGGTEAELSDLSEPENRFERSYRELLEVYLPIVTPGGERVLFETYQPFDSITASGRKIWLQFTPALILALVLLWLIQLPLALSLARRVRESQRERESLLRQAIESSDAERRRIAADLHDGVVQDLAGISYGLSAAADRVPPEESSGVATTLRSAATSTRQSMRRLRSLLVEIYPPNLQTVGLAAAITDLTAPLTASGTEVRVDVPADLRLRAPVEALLFRGAQEALRNVAKHAGAGTVDVRVEQVNGVVRLQVDDDGQGFSPEALEERRAEGHLGLRLLGDLAERAGGSLEIVPTPGVGTRLRLVVPA